MNYLINNNISTLIEKIADTPINNVVIEDDISNLESPITDDAFAW